MRLASYGDTGFRTVWSHIIAGLDPAIHLLSKEMDPRVKPRVTHRG
jgi:hypothetical protein